MGCDEHFFLEVKTDGKWRPYHNKVRNEYWKPGDEYEREWELPQFEQFTGGRNYNAYAIIADVRNGMSVLGGGRAFIPIAEAKGLPNDVSSEVREESDRWDSDGHSHTWLTLAELLAYPWYRYSTIYGDIGIREYAAWSEFRRKENRGPEDYSSSTSGGGIVHMTMAEADEYLNKKREELGSEYYDWVYGRGKFPPRRQFFDVEKIYVTAQWNRPYTEAVGDLYTRGIPEMIRVRDELGLTNDEVRAVGWFDN
jgi:hypothetical protein